MTHVLFVNGIDKLLDRWQQCIEKDEDVIIKEIVF